MTLVDIVQRFRRGIALAISLVVIEYVAWVVEPSVFGPVIDSLITMAGTHGADFSVWPVPV